MCSLLLTGNKHCVKKYLWGVWGAASPDQFKKTVKDQTIKSAKRMASYILRCQTIILLLMTK